ncbi:hypothetical protein ABT294_00540 [Nonomuraea sp. NPDC000554]|uniref:hypothetical protein n=1 Tax=Nonomuraea sp. NPDC000554 TaxID=3154259 RepID=UPI00331C93B3
MAWGGSGWYGDTISDALGTTQLGIDLELDTAKLALYDNTITPDFNAGNPAYSTTGEIVGTGYTAAGKLVTGTVLLASGGYIIWSGDNVQWTSSTLTGVRGGIILADYLSPAARRLIIGIDWGTAYATADGTLLVSWHANGIGRFDYIP